VIVYKKIVYVIVIALILGVTLVSLTGCAKKEGTATDNNTSEVNTMSENTSSSERVVDTIDYETAAEKQMAMPEVGDTIAIFHIKNYGDIKVKFFEEVAPKAVENFITHAKEGYYDGLIFHRVINEFMIQGGDPEGTGYGGESIWGEGFGTELDYELVPYRGSLCMAMSSQPNSIGSQFFITQAHYNESQVSYLKSSGYPEKLLDVYKEQGGYLSLYLQYTVFGQVYEGLDIVDKIAEVETDSNDKPLEDVVIESIEVTEYK
jgi:cyclophilin family peptidyl-prolyl cis-trans isomerase